MNNRIKNLNKELLSDYKCKLEKITLDYLRSDSRWQHEERVVFSRNDATTVLMYNKMNKMVILANQFRLPTYMNGNESGMLIEAPAGTIDENESPEVCIRREIEEETGYRVNSVKQIMQAYLSPGSVTERVYFFVAEYNSSLKIAPGGGTDETEDIEINEVLFTDIIAMVEDGRIKDAKTIMLIQYAQLHHLLD